MTERDSCIQMLAPAQASHDKHDFRNRGGEDLGDRAALMAEELGKISAVITKGKPLDPLAEECADLLILLLGTAIAADLDLARAFWDKLRILQQRESRMVRGRIRVSGFRNS